MDLAVYHHGEIHENSIFHGMVEDRDDLKKNISHIEWFYEDQKMDIGKPAIGDRIW